MRDIHGTATSQRIVDHASSMRCVNRVCAGAGAPASVFLLQYEIHTRNIGRWSLDDNNAGCPYRLWPTRNRKYLHIIIRVRARHRIFILTPLSICFIGGDDDDHVDSALWQDRVNTTGSWNFFCACVCVIFAPPLLLMCSIQAMRFDCPHFQYYSIANAVQKSFNDIQFPFCATVCLGSRLLWLVSDSLSIVCWRRC